MKLTLSSLMIKKDHNMICTALIVGRMLAGEEDIREAGKTLVALIFLDLLMAVFKVRGKNLIWVTYLANFSAVEIKNLKQKEAETSPLILKSHLKTPFLE